MSPDIIIIIIIIIYFHTLHKKEQMLEKVIATWFHVDRQLFITCVMHRLSAEHLQRRVLSLDDSTKIAQLLMLMLDDRECVAQLTFNTNKLMVWGRKTK